tara:strand:- start:346 stop:855 length:510 start_codon:yes stop_codon:yes gene_type:complete
MSFYLNDFKKHLKGLADNVDHPYDEPISRQKNYTSIEETYSAMNQPRMGSFQRPAPSMLNEQVLPWRQQTQFGGYYIVQDSAGNFYVVNAFSDGPGTVPVAGPFNDNRAAAAWVKGNPLPSGGNAQRANRDYPLPWRPNRKGDSFSNVQMRKDSPQLGGGFGGIGGGGG